MINYKTKLYHHGVKDQELDAASDDDIAEHRFKKALQLVDEKDDIIG